MGRSRTLGRLLKIVIGIVLGAVIAFVVITWLALEAGGVAVIETERADGTARSTHVWFATPDEADLLGRGELWAEAGTPENGWYVDLQDRGTLVLATTSKAHASDEYLALPIHGEAAHRKIRSLLRAKYGLRDWWIATLFDTSRSIAVRLIPIPPARSPTRVTPANAIATSVEA